MVVICVVLFFFAGVGALGVLVNVGFFLGVYCECGFGVVRCFVILLFMNIFSFSILLFIYLWVVSMMVGLIFRVILFVLLVISIMCMVWVCLLFLVSCGL